MSQFSDPNARVAQAWGSREPSSEEIEYDLDEMGKENDVIVQVQVLIEKHFGGNPDRGGHYNELLNIAKVCGSMLAENHVVAAQARAEYTRTKAREQAAKSAFHVVPPNKDGHSTPQ